MRSSRRISLLFESLVAKEWLTQQADAVVLTTAGERGFGDFGIDVATLKVGRRALCRPCLDWSVRRHHLAGALSAAILARIYARGWAKKDLVTRALHFTPIGEIEFARVCRAPR